MIKIGKITIRQIDDFEMTKSLRAYRNTIRELRKPLITSLFLFLLGLFVCYLNAFMSAFAFIIMNKLFDGFVSLAMALAMAYYTVIFYMESVNAINMYRKYEQLVYDILKDVETDIKNDTQLEIPFEEFKN